MEILNLPLDNFISSIRSFYLKKTVTPLLIIDQINGLAAMFRDYNNKLNSEDKDTLKFNN